VAHGQWLDAQLTASVATLVSDRPAMPVRHVKPTTLECA
jgi:hypothetical protein